MSGSNFLLNILLARMLGISEYGKFALLWIVLMFISTIHHAIVISPMLSIGPQEKNVRRYYDSLFVINFLFVSSIVLGLTAIVSVALLLGIAQSSLFENGIIFILVVFSFLMQDFFRRRYYSLKLIKKAIILDGISYIGMLLFLSVLTFILKIELDIENVLLMMGISFFLGSLYAYFDVEKAKSKKIFIILVMKKNWNSAKWLLASSVLVWSSGNLFILVAGQMLGIWAIGVIKAIQNIVGLLGLFFQILENTLSVEISSQFKKLERKSFFSYVINKLLKIESLVLILILCLVFFSEKILFIVYGDEYVDYAYLLSWFAVLNLFILMSMFMRFVLRAMQNTKPIFKAYLLSTIVSVISVFPIITIFKIDGILIGLTMAQIIFIFYTGKFAIKGLR